MHAYVTQRNAKLEFRYLVSLVAKPTIEEGRRLRRRLTTGSGG